MGCGASTPNKPAAAPTAAKRVSTEAPKADAGVTKPTETTIEVPKEVEAPPREKAEAAERASSNRFTAESGSKRLQDDYQDGRGDEAPMKKGTSERKGDDVVDFSGDAEPSAVDAGAYGRAESGQRAPPKGGARVDDGDADPVARSFTDGDGFAQAPELPSKPAPARATGNDDDDDPADDGILELPSGLTPADEPSVRGGSLKNKPSDGFD